MYIAVLHYTTKFGTETLIFRTDTIDITKLPEITNDLLLEGGVADPELGIVEGEKAEWLYILLVSDIPLITTKDDNNV